MSESKRCLPGITLIHCGRSKQQLNTILASAFSDDPARNDKGLFTPSSARHSASFGSLLTLLSFIIFSLEDYSNYRTQSCKYVLEFTWQVAKQQLSVETEGDTRKHCVLVLFVYTLAYLRIFITFVLFAVFYGWVTFCAYAV